MTQKSSLIVLRVHSKKLLQIAENQKVLIVNQAPRNQRKYFKNSVSFGMVKAKSNRDHGSVGFKLNVTVTVNSNTERPFLI